MEVLFASTLVVALAEMGDKTQLLAILLATKFLRPWPVVAAIFVSTLANHALAAWAGSAVAGLLDGFWFKLVVAIGFIVMAAWTLVPDKADGLSSRDRGGAFLTTLIAFFLVEIGDKTQIATVALGARYHQIGFVAAGTTLGMMLANVPAVVFGERITRIVPLHYVRWVAAAIFTMLGVAALIALLA